jgi:hypothetical protein
MNRRIFMRTSLGKWRFGSDLGNKNNDTENAKNEFANASSESSARMNIDISALQAIIGPVETHCARCNSPITCQPEGHCWCKEMPALPMPAESSGCLCRECLKSELKAKGVAIKEQI